jgi:hypothetical protein
MGAAEPGQGVIARFLADFRGDGAARRPAGQLSTWGPAEASLMGRGFHDGQLSRPTGSLGHCEDEVEPSYNSGMIERCGHRRGQAVVPRRITLGQDRI